MILYLFAVLLPISFVNSLDDQQIASLKDRLEADLFLKNMEKIDFPASAAAMSDQEEKQFDDDYVKHVLAVSPVTEVAEEAQKRNSVLPPGESLLEMERLIDELTDEVRKFRARLLVTSRSPAEDQTAMNHKLVRLLSELKSPELSSKRSLDVYNEPSTTCEDRDSMCESFAESGYCSTEADLMRLKCAKSCAFCCPEDKSAKCAQWAKVRACSTHKDMMKKMCFKTCGYCEKRMPSPPLCLSTPYKCCWDKKTPASGPNGEGCPECKNTMSLTFCMRWKDQCAVVNYTQGSQVRELCPQTCGLCGDVCIDDPVYAEDCPNYKQLNMCEENQMVKLYCPKTCGLCRMPACTDHMPTCSKYLKACNDPKTMERAVKACPLTCGRC